MGYIYKTLLEKEEEEAREMAQWSQALSLAEDLGLVPGTYTVAPHNLSLQFHAVLHLLLALADIRQP